MSAWDNDAVDADEHTDNRQEREKRKTSVLLYYFKKKKSVDSPPDSSGFEFGVRGIVRLHSGYFILSWEFLLQSRRGTW